LKELAYQPGIHLLAFIHAAHERGDFILGKLPHGVAQQSFFVVQVGNWPVRKS
jgi:hypothetical protein